MFVGIRDLWFAKGRFALMTSIIALVAFLVVVLSGLTGGLGSETTSAIEGLGATNIVFAESPDGPSFRESIVDASSANAWADIPGVEGSAPLGVSRASLEHKGEEISVTLFATTPDGWVSPADLAPGAIVVSPDLAASFGLNDGDTVQVGDVTMTVKVGDVSGSFSHQPVAWTELGSWQKLVDRPGKASVVVLDARGNIPSSAIDGMVAVTTNDSLSAIAGFSAEQGSLKLMQGFLIAISALVVGAFFTVWTVQRRRDIAVLKAIGASTPYLLGDAIGQAVVVVVAAATVGGGIGAIAGAFMSGTAPFLSSPETLVYPLILMSVIGLAGAALAIRSITKVDPLAALGASR